MSEQEWTTIRIHPSTRKKLEDLGAKKETYDDVIQRLLDE